MKILHILAGVPPGSGMAEYVPTLCRHLHRIGHEVTLATLDGSLSEATQAAEVAGVRLVRFAPSLPRALYFSWQMLRGLSALAHAADVVHVHGNWTFPVWWGCYCVARMGKPLVMSPHGSFDPVRLRHSAWKKRLVGWLDRTCLRWVAVVHVTSEAEREWVMDYCGHSVAAMGSVKKAKGGRGDSQEVRCSEREARIVVIPNGVELPGSSLLRECISSLVEEEGENAERRTPNAERRSGKRKTVLYLGRLHPLKGVDLLVEAWHSALVADDQKMEDGGQGTKGSGCETMDGTKPTNELMNSRTNELLLVIAGPDEQGTLRALKEQVARLGLEESVKFVGSVYGEEKWRMLRSADLFVLPSRSENFGIVVAEALACGVPVITTKGAPWSELMGEGSNAAGAAGSKEVQTAWRPGSNAAGAAGSKEVQTAWRPGSNAAGAAGSKEGSNGLAASFIPHPSSVADNGRCGWWVDVGVEPLEEALREALSLTDEERRIMGENGRRLVESKYRWETVAERMAAVYSGCLRG